MKRKNRKSGFTMAEMLIVVAIIGVLAAVAFVAVNQHQRSLERLERDSVAREIFVAAQNHLTMAQSQGYLGVGNQKGNVEDETKGYYFFVVNQGDIFSSDATPKSLIDLMLPYGSIDESVRGGGSYIIRYHADSATVMDVFYCSNPATDTRFGYRLNADEEKTLVDSWRDGKESARRNYNGKVLGWYGGADGESLKPSVTLEAPILVIENSDKLRVGVVDKNESGSLQIIVTGMTSKVQTVFNLKSSESGTALEEDRLDTTSKTLDNVACDYVIVLDDITTPNLHFADLTVTKADGTVQRFIPGEDIVVQAIAFDNTQISNIGYSAEITVNSLYEKLDLDADSEAMIASVSSIRHLENLDKRVSNVSDSRDIGEGATKVTYTLKNTVQTSDMDWELFKTNTNKNATAIQLYGKNAGFTVAGCCMPVVPTYSMSYEGSYHSVSNIKVSYAGNAGMFGSITGTGDTTNPTTIANLALIDFDIAQTGTGNVNAGALAGTLEKINVENVIAYNRKSTTGIVADSGNAGGLIGSASTCNVTKSAASLFVTATEGNAGGLIGMTDGGKVSSCYSGGHTNKGTYYNDDRTEIYNVQAAAKNAGGLIGVASDTPIDHSYATCSVTGQTAGGFVASAVGDVSFCYATGLVAGTGSDNITTVINGVSTSKTVTKDGAFAYSLSGKVDNCYYFEIINERKDEEAGYKCLKALGKEGEDENIKPLDSDYVDDLTLNIYNNLYANPAYWTNASAYDPKLIEYYDGKYNLLNVVKLGATDVIEAETTNEDGKTTPADFVATHYGDWPAPEIFVVNTPNS